MRLRLRNRLRMRLSF
uniref:Uncharacterized protein n=1 Tax=Anopheles quadriannulatus TaxID=34691 RepID=A0A182XR73_ANOQN